MMVYTLRRRMTHEEDIDVLKIYEGEADGSKKALRIVGGRERDGKAIVATRQRLYTVMFRGG